jgi:hypothetical protein
VRARIAGEASTPSCPAAQRRRRERRGVVAHGVHDAGVHSISIHDSTGDNMPKAKVEFRMVNNEPTVTVRVPRGTSLGDIAKIQASLFARPDRLKPPFSDLIRGCTNCLSGARFEFGEELVNPVTHDIQEMFTHLTTEMRAISSRLSSLERGPIRSEPAGNIADNVAEIEF